MSRHTEQGKADTGTSGARSTSGARPPAEGDPALDAAQVARLARKLGAPITNDPALLDLLLNAGDSAKLPDDVARLTMEVLRCLGELADLLHGNPEPVPRSAPHNG